MIGLVLAAGDGSRLYPLTADKPKTLIEVGRSTILGLTLENFAQAGIDEVLVVGGANSGKIEAWLREHVSVPEVEVMSTDRDSSWNNAYTLWTARERLNQGAVLVNGDTVCPAAVLELLKSQESDDIQIAVDYRSPLDGEEMKVAIDGSGFVAAIGKGLGPEQARAEYIGVACIPASAVETLTGALHTVFTRDKTVWYENAFEAMVRAGSRIRAVAIPDVEWVEVDTPEDLERARSLSWVSS